MKIKTIAAGTAALGALFLVSQTGMAQSAVNYFDVTRVVTGYGAAQCPSGFKVTGGGAKTIPADYFGTSSSDEYRLTGSYADSDHSWKATATRVHGSYSSLSGWRFTTSPYTPWVTAVCTN